MKEILFRVRDSETKEIVGYEYCQSDGVWWQIEIIAGEKHWIREGTYKGSFLREQWTCLNDKENTHIFEGDILKLDSWTGYQMVEFVEGAFCLTSYEGNGNYSDIHYIHHAGVPQAKVVGNIYQNPKLIK